jgi:hypothetical protein
MNDRTRLNYIAAAIVMAIITLGIFYKDNQIIYPISVPMFESELLTLEADNCTVLVDEAIARDGSNPETAVDFYSVTRHQAAVYLLQKRMFDIPRGNEKYALMDICEQNKFREEVIAFTKKKRLGK